MEIRTENNEKVKAIKYDILVRYLKVQIKKVYFDKEDIKEMLISLDEMESEE